jgi:serum/glucocorticoid-regulated kinase 2
MFPRLTVYRRVLHDELVFDDDAHVFDDDTRSLLRGLLQRDPLLRMTDARIKRSSYFSMIEWPHVFHQREFLFFLK